MRVTRDKSPATLSSTVRKAERRRNVVAELAAPCQFGFAVERAVFLTVLHQLFVSGSDRAAEKWHADYGSGAATRCGCMTSIAPWPGSASRWAARGAGAGLCHGPGGGGFVHPPPRPVWRIDRRLHGYHELALG